ncbi:MAG: carboxypeptidase-like regulatory domain-containing protein, partial [Pyrinomonadaceae bacterium]
FPGSNSGSRDLQFGAAAITFPALVKIIKNAVPDSSQPFIFTVSAPAGVTPSPNFTLVDDGSGTNNSQQLSGVTSFGTGNEITVTEANTPGWMLTDITCFESNGGLGTTANSTTSVGNRNAIIRTQEGEVITCTFTNEIVLAAGASIDGVITDSLGSGLAKVGVRVTNLDTGESFYTLTNPFGYYYVGDLEVGVNYAVRVSSKSYQFEPNTRVISLNEDAIGLNFTASPQ